MQETLAQNGCDLDALGPVSMVSFKTSSGFKGQANVVRLSPQSVTFEIYSPETMIRASELLNEFEILAETKPVYSGKAVVTNVLNTGTGIACEASLPNPIPGLNSMQSCTPEKLRLSGFPGFLSRWEKFYRVSHDYKVVVADLQTFLWSMRLWLEQVELTLQSCAPADRARIEQEIALGLRSQITSSLTSMFERFEEAANKIDPDLQPVHRAFGQRQLHPHLLCAPFIHRTYAKPLGYAGDYEMMNMIVRNGMEGGSLYAKLVNAYLLDQAPAHAVRNRVNFLCDRIGEETLRVAGQGRRARVYSIACGPACEVQSFLARGALADKAEFRLLDFNDETLAYTSSRLEESKRKHGRNTPISMVKNSVQSLLKASAKLAGDEPKYDLIYCSGLYDYLNERLIKTLNTYLYDRLHPGGLLIVGNFANNNPIQRIMEHALEWFLIYRTAQELTALGPNHAQADDCAVIAELSGTHLFLQVRKPK
jgi:extracellular factor (EF) 3-hydroxypalmitic acid methyl ester biosynthesis protein